MHPLVSAELVARLGDGPFLAALVVAPGLLGFIEHEVHVAGADPSNLVFEITETTLLRDIGKGEEFARGVVDLGCQLALDGFGTGFGTLTHVKKLRISYLKIDIEFIRDLVTSLGQSARGAGDRQPGTRVRLSDDRRRRRERRDVGPSQGIRG